MPIRKAVTLKTIAVHLGLTIQTVSRALKGKPGMSEGTRRLVVQAAEELGYYTSEQIRSLKIEQITPYPNLSLHFLLAQTEESVAYNRLLLKGLRDRFRAFGHQIEVVLLPKDLSEKQMIAWIEEREITYADGLFIAPSITPGLWETILLEIKITRIMLNYPKPGTKIDSVIWDVYEATYQAVDFLHKLGHQKIMYVGDIQSQRGYILRWQAFQHAMDQIGRIFDPEMYFFTNSPPTSDILACLKDRLLRSSPTAIICGISDEVHFVYEACKQLGWGIPEDVSIIGFLNENVLSYPQFTRPVLPIWEAGYRAADRMLWRLANPTLPYEHIRIQCEIETGVTTAKPRK
ncbi:LacI family DNA-binding transcriptional regulator [Cohnella fermenti]|nr:LacI family DNA-binding transcriptional regulator [Cohnella fermenti]